MGSLSSFTRVLVRGGGFTKAEKSEVQIEDVMSHKEEELSS